MDAFASLVEKVLEKMRAAEGNLWADGMRPMDDDPSYIVLSEWRTPADLDAWDEGTDARAFSEEADLHLRSEPTRRRFTA